MRKVIAVISIIVISASLFFYISAHSGRTDSDGGHYDHSTGEYHYHDGEYAGREQSSYSNYDNSEDTFEYPEDDSESSKSESKANKTKAVTEQKKKDIYSDLFNDGYYKPGDYLEFEIKALLIIAFSIIGISLIIGYFFQKYIKSIAYCAAVLFLVFLLAFIFSYSRTAYFTSVAVLAYINIIVSHLFPPITIGKDKLCRIDIHFITSPLIVISYTTVIAIFFSSAPFSKYLILFLTNTVLMLVSYVGAYCIAYGLMMLLAPIYLLAEYIFKKVIELMHKKNLFKNSRFIVGEKKKIFNDIFRLAEVPPKSNMYQSLKLTEYVFRKALRPTEQIQAEYELKLKHEIEELSKYREELYRESARDKEKYKKELRKLCEEYRLKKNTEIEKCQSEVDNYESENERRFKALQEEYTELQTKYNELLEYLSSQSENK